MRFFKNLSLERKSLRYKLLIAFALMSVIPLLIIAHFVTNYIFPNTENMVEVSVVVIFTLWISWLGYLLIRQIISPVIDLALETKLIAEGRMGSRVSSEREEELGDIAEAVNTMTTKIRSYIGELQDYSKKTASLNVQIHKKVITLTNLMQLGDLISTGAPFDEMAKFSAEKMADELQGGYAGILIKENTGEFSLKAFENNSGRDVPAGDIGGMVSGHEKVLAREEYMAMDSRPLEKGWQADLRQNMGIVNIILFPLKIHHNIIGCIFAGSYAEGHEFDEDAVSVIRAFEKEVILAYHSTRVFEKVKSLEVVDSMTGLYSRVYLEERMQDEIHRAVFYQRPCSLIVVKIDGFDKYSSHYGVGKAKQVIKKIAHLLTGLISPVGKVGRFEYDEFGMLIPEKNKRESIELAEEIRQQIENMKISADAADKVTVSIGVGENPIDGTNAEEIARKAYQNMLRAQQEGGNKVLGD